MSTVTVEASRRYEIRIARGLLDRAGEEIRGVTKAQTAVLVMGRNVEKLYGARVKASLEGAGLRVCPFALEPGEGSKSFESYGRLLRFLAQKHVARSDVLVALGGGVTGDLTGFAAATWQRGMDFVQIPTTLLAMVDSSVGGKTAINLESGKNQVGAFYQPALVLCDPDTLSTLPPEEYRCGCAEVLKYGVLGDAAFFESLRNKPIAEQEETVIERCVSMKRDFVAEDEFDRGRRQLLNLGHTFGHAVETCSGYTVLHGQAVAIGMTLISRAAAAKGYCSFETAGRIVETLRRYGLPTASAYPRAELAAALLADKKRRGDSLNLIVPRQIGRCEIVPVPVAELPEWLRLGGAV